MSITVTTPTGHIGSLVTDMLLGRGEHVTVVARDPKKVAHFARRGAAVVQGSHADAETLIKATQRADALFVLSPPDIRANDHRMHARRFGLAAARAVRKNQISHVVNLSAIGADLDGGSGPVLGLRDNEAILDSVASNLTHLRPGYFMENTLDQIPSLKLTGKIYSIFSGQKPIPMIATRDIAAYVTDLLVHRDWTGRQIVELCGSEDESFNQVAEILSRILGMPVRHETITAAQSKTVLEEIGASKHVADLLVELSQGINEGRIHFHKEDNFIAAPTSYTAFAREIFQPAYKSLNI